MIKKFKDESYFLGSHAQFNLILTLVVLEVAVVILVVEVGGGRFTSVSFWFSITFSRLFESTMSSK